MAIDFPTTLDNFTNPQATDKTDSPSHAGQHADLNDAVEAIQAKVGIDSSADTDSIDYKLTNASSSNPGHKHTLAHGATDVTASAAEVNILDGVTATAAELNVTDGADTTHKVLENGCLFRAYLANNASIAGDGNYYNIPFDAETFDVGSDVAVSGGVFTAPVTGYYSLSCTAVIVALPSTKNFVIRLQKNASGGSPLTISQMNFTAGADGNYSLVIEDIAYLTAGDTVQAQALHDTGSNKNISASAAGSHFNGYLLSV